jgi:hypothetical protein
VLDGAAEPRARQAGRGAGIDERTDRGALVCVEGGDLAAGQESFDDDGLELRRRGGRGVRASGRAVDHGDGRAGRLGDGAKALEGAFGHGVRGLAARVRREVDVILAEADEVDVAALGDDVVDPASRGGVGRTRGGGAPAAPVA